MKVLSTKSDEIKNLICKMLLIFHGDVDLFVRSLFFAILEKG